MTYLMHTIRWPGVSNEGACWVPRGVKVEVECDAMGVSPAEIGSICKAEKIMARKRTYQAIGTN